MKLVDALVEALASWGVRYVFGVSGANIEHLHDAIHRLGNGKLSSVLAKTETGAAFMADCRARTRNTLGVCCATSGGGMLNLAVGIAESFAESVPVLAIVGQPPSVLEGRGAFQDSSGIGRSVDAMRFWQSIAKYVAKLEHGRDFWLVLRAAVESALSGRRGPAVILIPRQVFDHEVGAAPIDWPCELERIGAPPPVTSAEALALFGLMRDARRPLVLLGQGVQRSPDAGAVAAFARRSRIPVATTLSARADYPNDDPLYVGTVGAAGHPSAHDYINDKVDLIVAAGTSLDVMTRGAIEKSFKDKRFAVIDVDTEAIHRIVKPDVAVRGDVGRTFRTLLGLLEEAPFQARPVPEEYRLRYYQACIAPSLAATPSDVGNDVLLQSQALSLLAEYLPQRGHIVLDAGNCAAAALHYHSVPEGSSSTIALGMGGMGYSIPAAIGAQLGAEPGARTVALCGDGAFLMLGLEVHTAIDLRLPILFVVFNNAMHGMCVTRQQKFFDSRIEAVCYPRADFAAVARGLAAPDRLWVGSASSVAELAACLRDYHASYAALPGVLDLNIAREELPPFAPFLGPDAPTITALSDLRLIPEDTHLARPPARRC